MSAITCVDHIIHCCKVNTSSAIANFETTLQGFKTWLDSELCMFTARLCRFPSDAPVSPTNVLDQGTGLELELLHRLRTMAAHCPECLGGVKCRISLCVIVCNNRNCMKNKVSFIFI